MRVEFNRGPAREYPCGPALSETRPKLPFFVLLLCGPVYILPRRFPGRRPASADLDPPKDGGGEFDVPRTRSASSYGRRASPPP